MDEEEGNLKLIKENVNSLVVRGTPLAEIKKEIEKLFSLSFLPSVEDNYADFHYFESCLLHLEPAVKQCLGANAITTADSLKSFVMKTFNARRLRELPEEIKQLTHCRLMLNEVGLLTDEANVLVLEKIQKLVALAFTARNVSASVTSNKADKLLLKVKQRAVMFKAALLRSSEGSQKWSNFASSYSSDASKNDNEYNIVSQEISQLYSDLEKEPMSMDEVNKDVAELRSQLEQSFSCSGPSYIQGKNTVVIKQPVLVLSQCLSTIESYVTGTEEVHIIYLSIFTIGGDGGDGQPGGKGANGKEGARGAEMSLYTLKSEYPSGARYSPTSSSDSLTTTIPNIMNRFSVDAYNNNFKSRMNLSTGKSEKDAMKKACYLRGKNSDGLFVEYSYYEEDFVLAHTRQTIMLVKGAPGLPGELEGLGGCGGWGGAGGYCGTFESFCLNGICRGRVCYSNIKT